MTLFCAIFVVIKLNDKVSSLEEELKVSKNNAKKEASALVYQMQQVRAIPFLIQGGGRNEAKNNDRGRGWSQKMMIGGWRRSTEASPYICIAKKLMLGGRKGSNILMIGGGGCLPMLHSDPPWIKNGIALINYFEYYLSDL